MKATRRALLCLLLVVAWAAPAPALAADLQAQAQRIINSAGLQQTHVGLYVLDLNSNQELFELNPDDPLMPASNMKLVTTAAATKILGPDFVFHTTLAVVEPQDWPATPAAAPGGAGAGAGAAPASSAGQVLVVHGDGDPGFADPVMLAAKNTDVEAFLQTWVAAVRNAHVTKVDQLIIDDRVFDHTWVHPSWPEEQLSHWYCAQVAGLAFFDNCLDVYTDPTTVGQNPRVRIVPAAPFLSTTNRAVTSASTDTFWISRRANSNELIYRGDVRTHRVVPYNITVNDPPLFFGQVLAERLIEAGITVGGISRPSADDRLPAGRVIASVDDPLATVLQRCNKDSQNLFAESFFKRIGRKLTGMPGSWENGAAAVRNFLHEELGNQSADLTITDGSGLSRENRVTARALVGLLAGMQRDPAAGPVYRASLSVGGADGTLRKRFHQDFNGQIFGKSGYIVGVSSLSGYLVLADAAGGEHTVAFSFLFNGFRPPISPPDVKHVQDQLVKLIDQYVTASTEQVKQGG